MQPRATYGYLAAACLILAAFVVVMVVDAKSETIPGLPYDCDWTRRQIDSVIEVQRDSIALLWTWLQEAQERTAEAQQAQQIAHGLYLGELRR